jgi:hypothetical protein
LYESVITTCSKAYRILAGERDILEKSGIYTGATLANANIVKNSFKHKEITMVIGILMAAIVIITLRIRTPNEHVAKGSIKFPSVKPIISKSFIGTAAELML